MGGAYPAVIDGDSHFVGYSTNAINDSSQIPVNRRQFVETEPHHILPNVIQVNPKQQSRATFDSTGNGEWLLWWDFDVPLPSTSFASADCPTSIFLSVAVTDDVFPGGAGAEEPTFTLDVSQVLDNAVVHFADMIAGTPMRQWTTLIWGGLRPWLASAKMNFWIKAKCAPKFFKKLIGVTPKDKGYPCFLSLVISYPGASFNIWKEDLVGGGRVLETVRSESDASEFALPVSSQESSLGSPCHWEHVCGPPECPG